MRRTTLSGAFLLFLGALLLTACGGQDEPARDPARVLNDEATELMRTAWGDGEMLEEALAKLDSALEKNPDLNIAQGNRINVLLQLARYPEAIEAIESLIGKTENEELRLMLCMVEEVAYEEKGANQDCYETVATQLQGTKEDNAYRDPNYVLALKMAESDEFSAVADQFLAAVDTEVAREIYERMLLESSREEIVQEMLPYTKREVVER